MTDTGRGAWTKRGFPDGFTRMYRRHMTGKATGSEPGRDLDFEAVHFGVLAIQNLLNYNGVVLDYTTGPGIFGPKTDAAVRRYQAAYVKPADGIAGPNTLKALLRKPIKQYQSAYGIPDNLLAGLVAQESGFDPGAVGYSTPADLGLVQINTNVVSVTHEQVFDPFYSLPWAARRMNSKFAVFSATTNDLKFAWDCAVLSHRSPVWAEKLFRTKIYPNEDSQKYVENIRKFGLAYG